MFGRLDAVAAIVNEVSNFAVEDPDTDHPTMVSRPANAPVCYPFLWDTPQHDVVEWLGIAKNGGLLDVLTLSRNVGEVHEALVDALGPISAAERSAIFGGTAARFYGIGPA